MTIKLMHEEKKRLVCQNFNLFIVKFCLNNNPKCMIQIFFFWSQISF